MGAAQLLQALPDPTLFCDAVVESSFASFREVAFDRVGQRVGRGPWLGRTLLRPAIEIGFITARLRTGFDVSQANPARALRESRTPVLLIHGLADRNMPLRHAEALAAANPEQVTLWLVPGATHVSAWAAAPVEYPARVLAFFASHE
jgi:pimeloyl-ACP methyl ester carboxylesterase